MEPRNTRNTRKCFLTQRRKDAETKCAEEALLRREDSAIAEPKDAPKMLCFGGDLAEGNPKGA